MHFNVRCCLLFPYSHTYVLFYLRCSVLLPCICMRDVVKLSHCIDICTWLCVWTWEYVDVCVCWCYARMTVGVIQCHSRGGVSRVSGEDLVCELLCVSFMYSGVDGCPLVGSHTCDAVSLPRYSQRAVCWMGWLATILSSVVGTTAS